MNNKIWNRTRKENMSKVSLRKMGRFTQDTSKTTNSMAKVKSNIQTVVPTLVNDKTTFKKVKELRHGQMVLNTLASLNSI